MIVIVICSCFFCAMIKIGIKSIDFETTENVFGCRRSPLFLLFLRARSMGSDGVHDTNSCVGLDTSIDPHFHSTIVAHNFYAQFSHSESSASNVLLCLWSVNIHSNQHACSYLDVCCFVWFGCSLVHLPICSLCVVFRTFCFNLWFRINFNIQENNIRCAARWRASMHSKWTQLVAHSMFFCVLFRFFRMKTIRTSFSFFHFCGNRTSVENKNWKINRLNVDQWRSVAQPNYHWNILFDC